MELGFSDGITKQRRGVSDAGAPRPPGKGVIHPHTMNVFSYGSLMFPEVFTALTGREYQFEGVTLPGFERRAIIGKIYPGLRGDSDTFTDGRLWFDLDDEAMRILDLFEDPRYDRRTVEVASLTRGLVEARAYVIPPSLESTLANDPWDEVKFVDEHLSQYIQMCREFRADTLAGPKGV